MRVASLLPPHGLMLDDHPTRMTTSTPAIQYTRERRLIPDPTRPDLYTPCENGLCGHFDPSKYSTVFGSWQGLNSATATERTFLSPAQRDNIAQQTQWRNVSRYTGFPNDTKLQAASLWPSLKQILYLDDRMTLTLPR